MEPRCIDRTRRILDVPTLKTIFDRKPPPPSVPPRGRGDAGELAAGTGALLRQSTYTPRHTAYDLRKIRSKGRIGRVGRPARIWQLLCASRIGGITDKPHAGDAWHHVLEQLHACSNEPRIVHLRQPCEVTARPGDAGRLKPGRPPKEPHPLDVDHDNLQREMRRIFRALRLAA